MITFQFFLGSRADRVRLKGENDTVVSKRGKKTLDKRRHPIIIKTKQKQNLSRWDYKGNVLT